MRIVYDLESTGLLNQESIDYTKFPLKFRPTFQIHCLVAMDIDTGEIYKFYEDTIKDIPEFFEKVTCVVGHNIIGYDNLVLRMYFGLHFKVIPETSLNKRPIEMHDTLVMSRMLYPDRKGGHSLDAWGKRTGVYKSGYGKTQDWKVFTPEMLEYCVDDVKASLATYRALIKEWGKWDWQDAYGLEMAVADLTAQQEQVGFHFNTQLAEECVLELNQWLEEIELDVEPKLPLKRISKGNAKEFTPPKEQFLKSGKPNSYIQKFVAKHDGEWIDDRTVKLFGEVHELPLPQKTMKDHEPMTLANQIELKQWLVSAGWTPLVWNEKDLTLDSKKRKLTPEKFRTAALRYIEETLGKPYEEWRCERLRCEPYELRGKLLNHDLRRPLKVYTAPKFTINQDKDIDPALIRLGAKYDFVKDVVKWLTYRHRRNSIQSPKGTGFLANVREDGRIPTPANPCGASTSRYQHNIVCNIPRVTSLYGDKMRDMFGAAPGYLQLGYDASGLEARIEGHYTIQFPGGEEYAKDLVAEKPNDIHTKHAKRNGITRDEQKTLKYSISYGAQPPKVSKQMGWSIQRATKTFEAFWLSALPLKTLKERVVGYWKKIGNKQFVKAVDGRKLFVRSEHSIINMVFQSAGVICCKRANVMHHIRLEEEGLLFDPFVDETMEGKCHAMIHYHDEAQWQVCPSLIDVYTFDSKKDAEAFEVEGKFLGDATELDGKWVRTYSLVGSLAKQAMIDAGKYYKLRVNLDSDYIINRSWKGCH